MDPDDTLPRTPGLGDSQRRILLSLKLGGRRSVAEIREELDLATETVREHLKVLAGRGLVERAGRRSDGPGRPEILYRLADDGEALFPRGEDRILGELARYLLDEEGGEALLRDFFEARLARRRERAMDRVDGLDGRARLEEVAAILTEEGYMADVIEDGDADGSPVLRLSHCPIMGLVAVSRLPCEAEIAFVRELVGGELHRVRYMPAGDHTCSYVTRAENEDGEAT